MGLLPHTSLPQFPPELPVSRWAVASLLNRMKKKESSIFLVRPCPDLCWCATTVPRTRCRPACSMDHAFLNPKPPCCRSLPRRLAASCPWPKLRGGRLARQVAVAACVLAAAAAAATLRRVLAAAEAAAVAAASWSAACARCWMAAAHWPQQAFTPSTWGAARSGRCHPCPRGGLAALL